MGSSWLAIDVATAPAQRARELRSAWEAFVDDGRVTPGQVRGTSLREPIIASWRRCAAAGVDPSGSRMAPVLADADEASARWDVNPLAEMAPLMRACLAASSDESAHLIVVSDAGGMLLWVEGNARVRGRAADCMNFVEGTLWSEGGAGTNAIGTALAADHAVQVFAAEHFNEVVQQWTCAAAPVHDPEDGSVIGVIDLTGEMESVHPHSMAVAVATAQAVEARLRYEMLERDSRLLARHDDPLRAGGARALLAPSGRVIATWPVGWLATTRVRLPPEGGSVALGAGRTATAERLAGGAYLLVASGAAGSADGARPRLSLRLLGHDHGTAEVRTGGPEDTHGVELRLRHAEILTLLCAHPDGLSSEELSRGVYGDPGRTGSIRVEISRLRKRFGACIDTDRYRLRGAVDSDVARVVGLLGRGQVRRAVEQYPGPLLPRSLAPGVIHEREALESWLRHSVMSAGDHEALWEWVQGDSGAGDIPAWKRLLANLPFQDPRRALAAARVARLRAEHPGEAELPLTAR